MLVYQTLVWPGAEDPGGLPNPRLLGFKPYPKGYSLCQVAREHDQLEYSKKCQPSTATLGMCSKQNIIEIIEIEYLNWSSLIKSLLPGCYLCTLQPNSDGKLVPIIKRYFVSCCSILDIKVIFFQMSFVGKLQACIVSSRIHISDHTSDSVSPPNIFFSFFHSEVSVTCSSCEIFCLWLVKHTPTYKNVILIWIFFVYTFLGLILCIEWKNWNKEWRGFSASLRKTLCNLGIYSEQTLSLWFAPLLYSWEILKPKLWFVGSRAQVGIIQFCLNLWKSLSNFVRHSKHFCIWSNVLLHTRLQSTKWYYIAMPQVLLRVWCSVYLQNHYTIIVLSVTIRPDCKLHSTKYNPQALNGDTLSANISHCSEKQLKKKFSAICW